MTAPETGRAQAPAGGIDTHAHVFRSDLPMAADARYRPSADAPLETYLRLLDGEGLDGGVLVQPSFLGTDNRHLVYCLRLAAGRLKGIAVVAPDIGSQDLDRLAAAGVVGIRLNLVGRALPRLDEEPWPRLFANLAGRGWQVEVHAEGSAWPALLPGLCRAGLPIVIDHFGRPESTLGTSCSGFRALLAAMVEAPIHVKLSGPYRFGADAARDCAAALLDRVGPSRLVWGSDWPWTQQPPGLSYRRTLAWLEDWVADAAARRAILVDTPRALFGFPPPA